MSIDKDLLLFVLTGILALVSWFFQNMKANHDAEVKDIKESLRTHEARINAIEGAANVARLQMEYIQNAVQRIEEGFKKQEEKREVFLKDIQATFSRIENDIKALQLAK